MRCSCCSTYIKAWESPTRAYTFFVRPLGEQLSVHLADDVMYNADGFGPEVIVKNTPVETRHARWVACATEAAAAAKMSDVSSSWGVLQSNTHVKLESATSLYDLRLTQLATVC